MDKNAKIYVAGHMGMVGSAITRKLQEQGYQNIITRSLDELNLIEQDQVRAFFQQEKPDYVFLAAAKVGGIYANNTYPASFIYDNLAIELNVIQSAYENEVEKLLFLGSSCIYPRDAAQPITEDALLTGKLESTNEAYALAKIAGVKMCEFYNKQYGTDYISAMPTNLYGPNDNYHPENSHVLPALIRRIHEAKRDGLSEVVVWGTGTPLREFLYVEDLADACVFLMERYSGNETVNVGSGQEVSILELAQLVKKVIGYQGDITLDKTKPDGTPRKLLDVSKLNRLGWQSKTSLEQGIGLAYQDFLSKHA